MTRNTWIPGFLAALSLRMVPRKREADVRPMATGKKSGNREKRVERRRVKDARRRNR